MAEAGLGLPLCPIVSLSVFLSFVYLRVTPSSFLPKSPPTNRRRPSHFPCFHPKQASQLPRCGLLISSRRFTRWPMRGRWLELGCLDASGGRVTCGADVIGFIMVMSASPPPADGHDRMMGLEWTVKEGLAWEMPRRVQAARWTQS